MVYLLSLLSAGLLYASFYPLDWWWLSFIALVPYAVILYDKRRFSLRQAVFAGALLGLCFSLGIAFAVVMQFHWYAFAEIVTIAMQLLWIPIALFSLCLGALGSWIFRRLSRTPLGDIFLFAAMWTATEMVRQWLLVYFDYGMLGYTMHALPFFMAFAGIGGVLLVSFILVLINAVFAYAIVYRSWVKKDAFILIGITVIICAVFAGNMVYLQSVHAPTKQITISTAQLNGESDPFGSIAPDGTFSFPARTESLLRAAVFQGPDFLIYPFNPVGGVLTDGSSSQQGKDFLSGTLDQFGSWIHSFVPAGTTFVTWTSTLRSGKGIMAEIEFWDHSGLSSAYAKRDLFPFLDFTPEFIARRGYYTTFFDYVPGPQDQLVTSHGITIGDLICSELNNAPLARQDGSRADVIFAIGSDAEFRDATMGERNVVLAQFRAAENNVFVVRSDRKGPSAIIAPDGSILAGMEFEKNGILSDQLSVPTQRAVAIYDYVGEWLIGFLLLVIFLYHSFRKRLPTRRV
ncbi:hypothetical protein KGO95_02340 [Patescibacteria group bacterium]|nr:hypothetical protein [Patescibacteria group bacterium]